MQWACPFSFPKKKTACVPHALHEEERPFHENGSIKTLQTTSLNQSVRVKILSSWESQNCSHREERALTNLDTHDGDLNWVEQWNRAIVVGCQKHRSFPSKPLTYLSLCTPMMNEMCRAAWYLPYIRIIPCQRLLNPRVK